MCIGFESLKIKKKPSLGVQNAKMALQGMQEMKVPPNCKVSFTNLRVQGEDHEGVYILFCLDLLTEFHWCTGLPLVVEFCYLR